MSDHSALHTGFATVSRNILRHLHSTGKYELAELGWFAPRRDTCLQENMPQWKVYTTDSSSFVNADLDRYGKKSLPNVLSDFRPDILFTIGDEWMTNHATDHKNKFGYLTASYFPIDSLPVFASWCETFKKPDATVMYGQWGIEVVRQRDPDFNPAGYIYHGIDTSVFHPVSKEERDAMRKKMGLDEDSFLVGNCNRNQPRKNIPALVKAFAMFQKEHRMCPVTHKPWFSRKEDLYMNEFFYVISDMPFFQKMIEDPTISPFTGEKGILIKEKPKAKLYLHMCMDDVGWDLREYIGRFKLAHNVILNPGLQVGHGVSDKELNLIYNSMDVSCSPTIGEGFGLSILESMACAVPILVTNYSAHTEWCKPGGLLIKVKTFFTEPKSNHERALCDEVDMVWKFDRFYYGAEMFNHLYGTELGEDQCGKKARELCGKNGLAVAQKMDWKKDICPQWEMLFDSMLQRKRPEVLVPEKKEMESA